MRCANIDPTPRATKNPATASKYWPKSRRVSRLVRPRIFGSLNGITHPQTVLMNLGFRLGSPSSPGSGRCGP